MMIEDKLSIELTLEESGVLCHLLLQSIVRTQRSDPFSKRMAALYERLCSVNDKLMGKKS